MKHIVIPDVQSKPGQSRDHLKWAASFIVDHKPDAIICLGDFSDMESLSSYDVGKKSFEGRRYTRDIDAAHEAMDSFMSPIFSEKERLKRNKEKGWNPKLIMCLGNHEDRINKAINNDPKLDGLISVTDLGYSAYGWEVHPYLEVVPVSGVCYSHYFVSGVMGRPVTSAKMLLTKHHMSCVAGHQQGRDIAYGQKADGTRMTAIISGSYYCHDEEYLTPQTNNCWHGIWQLNDVTQHGSFDEMPLSINYLQKRYDKNKHGKNTDVS